MHNGDSKESGALSLGIATEVDLAVLQPADLSACLPKWRRGFAQYPPASSGRTTLGVWNPACDIS
jgi:hypothetical protein